MAKVIMVQGTASNAGKSVLVAALCRIFKQDGYKVAPFKSQNMALNSFITKDGLEMGRAQAMQAQACDIEPDVRMNPILLKPTSDCGSQVILNGKATGNQTAKEYFSNKSTLKPFIKQTFDSLASDFDIIVIEGAGSPAEINLKQDDIVNMGMAKLANAPVLLVGDIDRGGVFASLYGTVKLLDKDEQDRICGLVINKFRGDPEILSSGLEMLENLTEKSVLGVVPYMQIDIDDEDSLSSRLDNKNRVDLINIAVIKLPHISNFTDFDPLSRINGVGLNYVQRPDQFVNADLIIIPGTKSTIDDLRWIRENGLEAQILKSHAKGTPIFGICGGYQMMGQHISDPENTECGGEIAGIGLLPTKTVFLKNKTTLQVTGEILDIDGIFSSLTGKNTVGYEIHMGETTLLNHARPFQRLKRDKNEILDGAFYNNAYGTYLHGIFDNSEITGSILNALAKKKNISIENDYINLEQYKQIQYDKLADLVRNSLDIDKIYSVMEDFSCRKQKD